MLHGQIPPEQNKSTSSLSKYEKIIVDGARLNKNYYGMLFLDIKQLQQELL
jgi:hypothetical protein